MEPTFPSKRDVWLAVVLWLGTAMLVAGAIVTFASAGPFAARCALAGSMLAAGAFGLWVFHSTGYRVTAAEIAVRSGPFRWHVPLGVIESVVPSSNPLSSPACSLDRLLIRYRGARGRRRAILLSPADKSGFLAAIAARCPALMLAGDRLVPRARAGDAEIPEALNHVT